ncbi:hypothetical protein BH09BAC3_BH09BAC3_17480 [soil metagenome]
MNEMKVFLLVVIYLTSVCCHQKAKGKTALFDKGISLGTNKNGKLEEASGLVESIKQPNYFWTHNDSGNPAMIFLVGKDAKTRKTFRLANASNRDWEDITIGSGPKPGTSYLYIGDIGDNLAEHALKYIYRIEEPSVNQNEEITDVKKLIVKLEDGARDAETIMFDPPTKNLYLVSKREAMVLLYEITYPFEADTIIAKKVATLPFTLISGGAISPDGKEVLLRNYTDIFYWKKKGNESISELLQTQATELPYDREPQGEAIAWARDSTGYYTLSENAKGTRAKLYFYKRN